MSDIKRCPACGIRLRIERNYQTKENGIQYTVQEYVCLHKVCSNFKQPVEVVKTELTTDTTP